MRPAFAAPRGGQLRPPAAGAVGGASGALTAFSVDTWRALQCGLRRPVVGGRSSLSRYLAGMRRALGAERPPEQAAAGGGPADAPCAQRRAAAEACCLAPWAGLAAAAVYTNASARDPVDELLLCRAAWAAAGAAWMGGCFRAVSRAPVLAAGGDRSMWAAGAAGSVCVVSDCATVREMALKPSGAARAGPWMGRLGTSGRDSAVRPRVRWVPAHLGFGEALATRVLPSDWEGNGRTDEVAEKACAACRAPAPLRAERAFERRPCVPPAMFPARAAFAVRARVCSGARCRPAGAGASRSGSSGTLGVPRNLEITNLSECRAIGSRSSSRPPARQTFLFAFDPKVKFLAPRHTPPMRISGHTLEHLSAPKPRHPKARLVHGLGECAAAARWRAQATNRSSA